MTADLIISAFATLFVTIDPVGLVPIFLVLTADLDGRARLRVARVACLVAFCILALAAVGGQALLGALGITLDAFRIAGGLFLLYTGFEMLFEKRQLRRSRDVETAAEDRIANVAAVPLAIPLMAGPGAITAVILLASRSGDAASLAAIIAVIAAVILISLAIFAAGARIAGLLGDTGRTVLSRLLGLLLGALAVQFIADGVRSFFGL